MTWNLIKFRLLHHSLFLPWMALVLLLSGLILRYIAPRVGSFKLLVLSRVCLPLGWAMILIYAAANDGLGYLFFRICFFCIVFFVSFLLLRRFFPKTK